MKSLSPWPTLLALVLPLAAQDSAPPARKVPNVLFLAIDDLRPTLGCYGDPVAVSPNIDALAARGVRFDRAYCQEAVCAPSRLSLMTGLRPDTIEVWDLSTHFREARPDAVTLPQYFKECGYLTRSVGKIFHGGGVAATDPPSWSVDPEFDTGVGQRQRYARPENLREEGLKQAAAEAADVADDHYVDGQVCNAALAALEDCAAGEAPFFLAVGFRKPHLPFCAPQRYWDLHERDALPAPESTEHPDGAPELATRSWQELEGYSDVSDDGDLEAEQVAELRHGYYACVSYIDALVGRLLERLEGLGLTDDTVVVLWGDHGFHLGEQGLWTKANNFEWATRVPLIVAAPRVPGAGGLVTTGLVELVDLYPTLAELCGLGIPDGLEGSSFAPLLQEPARAWKQAAFSQYPRAHEGHRHRRNGDVMGRTLRTDRYRYVEWRDVKTGELLGRELYDHATDPGEMQNVAASTARASTVRQLSELLRAGWTAALPAR